MDGPAIPVNFGHEDEQQLLHRYPLIVEHLQRLGAEIDNTRVNLQNQISHLTPGLRVSDGVALQSLDQAAHSFQTSNDALLETFQHFRSYFLSAGAGVGTGAVATINPELVSPAPAPEVGTQNNMGLHTLPQTSHFDQAKCEISKIWETFEKEMDSAVSQSGTLSKPRGHERTQLAVQHFVFRVDSLYSYLYELLGRILAKLTSWQTSRTRFIAELDEIQFAYRTIFSVNENCLAHISKSVSCFRQKLSLSCPSDVLELEKKFLEIRRDLIFKSLVIEELPNRIYSVGHTLRAKVRCLLEQGVAGISMSSSVKALVVTQEEMARLNEKTRNCSWVRVIPPPYTNVAVGALIDNERNSSGRSLRFGSAIRAIRRFRPTQTSAQASHVTLEFLNRFGDSNSYQLQPAYSDMRFVEVDWSPGINLTATFKAQFATGCIRRERRDGRNRAVVQEQFYIIFHTEAVEYLNEERIPLWAWTATPKSLCFITSFRQSVIAMEDIIWCDACDLGDTEPMVQYTGDRHGQETLPRHQLGAVLKEWLHDTTNVEISSMQLEHLLNKIQSYPTVDAKHTAPVLIPTGHIARNQFSGTKLPHKDTTCWEWLYAILRLIKRHLCSRIINGVKHNGPFEDGKISFMSRRDAEEVLKDSPVGTFLVRFSNTTEAGIAIGCVSGDDRKIQFVGPLLSDNLKVHSLASFVMSCKDLIWLYPDIPKESDDGFGKYIVEDQPMRGYTKMYQFFSARSKSKDEMKASDGTDNPIPSTSAAALQKPAAASSTSQNVDTVSTWVAVNNVRSSIDSTVHVDLNVNTGTIDTSSVATNVHELQPHAMDVDFESDLADFLAEGTVVQGRTNSTGAEGSECPMSDDPTN